MLFLIVNGLGEVDSSKEEFALLFENEGIVKGDQRDALDSQVDAPAQGCRERTTCVGGVWQRGGGMMGAHVASLTTTICVLQFLDLVTPRT